jgi:hypothetical protein
VERFWLGTHMPGWLGVTDVPLFVSNRTLAPRKTFPRALGPWALDSGGFSELTLYGEWRTTPAQYVELARRYASEIGGMEWAAIQDWMCERHMIDRTGLSVAEHQRRSTVSYLTLVDAAPELPWTPVLQGQHVDDYLRHADAYEAAGVRLSTLPIVGIGSVCRRQATREIVPIVRAVTRRGIRLHGFGVKRTGLEQIGHLLTSADSLAWSFTARREQIRLPGHTHKNCANCLPFALNWRRGILAIPASVEPDCYQPSLWEIPA